MDGGSDDDGACIDDGGCGDGRCIFSICMRTTSRSTFHRFSMPIPKN